MNELVMPGKQPRPGTAIRLWTLLAAAVALVLAANAHLVYVAIKSQPACVTHLEQGKGDAARGLFSAADSSCSPAAAGAGRS
jgi:uncharacterized membrane protein